MQEIAFFNVFEIEKVKFSIPKKFVFPKKFGMTIFTLDTLIVLGDSGINYYTNLVL